MQSGTQKSFLSAELVMNISKTFFSCEYKRMEYAIKSVLPNILELSDSFINDVLLSVTPL